MSRESDILKYRNYFNGNITAMCSGFYSRFGDSDIQSADRIDNKDIPIKNHCREALQKRMALIPTSTVAFEIFKDGESDDALNEYVNDWISGNNFDGKDLWSWADEVLKDLEIDGEEPVKMILKNGIPQCRIIDSVKFDIETSTTNILDVTGYTAEYEIEVNNSDETKSVTIKETIDANGYRMTQDGAELPDPYTAEHNFGFIPLVLIVRDRIKGETHGRSGMADLIEPQDNITRCSINIARANKYGGYGLFAFDDYSQATPDTISIEPGSIAGAKLTRISASGADASLFDEEDKYIDHLYSLAGVKRTTKDEMKQAPNQSGKAITVLTAEGKRQVDKVMSALKNGLSTVVRYALVMADKIDSPEDVKVVCTFEDLYTEDPQSRLSKAQFLDGIGFVQESLRVMGYTDDQIESLMAERETVDMVGL